MVKRYILPLSLQVKWVRMLETYSCEWVAGLKLKGEVIDWFSFTLGSNSEVKPVSLKHVSKPVGTVHSHPYKHVKLPIPSIEDGLNWVYHGLCEIPNNLNPIFFIVFKDKYASWAMFPKPPIIRKEWLKEYRKTGDPEKTSINICLKLLKKNMIKTGIFQLSIKDKEFPTF